MSASPLRVMVVDDEPLARERITQLLQHAADVRISVCDNGHAAVEAIRQGGVDLVFLDVQMPGMTGLEVVEEIGATLMPLTIFVTAYDQFALRAFDSAAIDYLLKPFSDERFETALARARSRAEMRGSAGMVARLRSAFDEAMVEHGVPRDTAMHSGAYLERIAVESPGLVRVVPVDDIDYISASGVYAELHVAGKVFVVRERMQQLEERLHPRQFFRVHRSAIVQLDRIDLLMRHAGGDYTLKLKNGAQLSVSRSRIRQLEAWMGVTEGGG